MLTVILRRLEFYGYHGVTAEERAVGHRFAVSAEVDVAVPSPLTDEVDETVDYAALGQVLLEALAGEPCRTVEAAASRAARAVLARFPRAVEIRLELTKRLPPVPLTVEETGVRLTLRRSGPGL